MEQLKHFLINLVPSKPHLGRIGSLELTIWLAQIFGLPYINLKEETRFFRIFLVIYGTISMMTVTLVYTALELYHLILNANNLEVLAQNACLSLTHLTGFSKMLNTLWRLPDLAKLVVNLKEMTRSYILTNKQKRAFADGELENKLLLSIYSSMVAATAIMGVLILIISPENFAGKKFPYCVQLPNWLPHSMQLSYMAVSVLMIAMQIVSTDYLNVTLINQTRYQLNILILSFEELSIATADQTNKRLNSIIQHHCLLMKLCNGIESIYRYPILLQFFTSLIIFAMSGFCATVASDSISGGGLIYLYSGCIFCELFFYCWFGNEVYEKSKALVTSGFACAWSDFDYTFKSSLMIFLTNSQRPILFTAGGFMGLSLPSFAGILSKSYSYIALLRQMYSD